MSQRIFRKATVPLLAAMALAGCSLAPSYERPEAPVPGQYPNAQQPVDPAAAGYSSDLGWSEFFRDERLKALISLALENNRDMRIAVQRVEEARAQYGIADSDRWPTIGAGANGQITRTPENLRMGGSGSPSVSRTYQAGIGLTSFEFDFFGRLRNLSEAAFQQYLSTAQARRTVHINLVAQVAEAYFRYDAGVASALDLNQARGQLETVRSDLASIRREQAQAANALHLLLGAEVPADIPEGAIFGKDQILAAIPVGLPSDLLERRPDIMGAEHVLLAANANIGAARAAFFPNISITGLLGFASSELGGLFSSDQRYWQYAPQIQIPIFSGGSLRGNLDLAKVRKNIAVADYEKTIQTAFREVADALAGEATYASQLDALRELEASAAESLKLARLRYETGIDSFLQVQTAEVTLYTAQQQFLQTGMDSLMNRVELYKALGGGWLENTAQAADTTAQGSIQGSVQGLHPAPEGVARQADAATQGAATQGAQ
jgi:multidrug efflux system outer membrane protein